MAFELQVVTHGPLTHERDPRMVARMFSEMIGLVGGRGRASDLSFRVLYDVFLTHPTKSWTVEEIATHLDVGQTAVYRHINKIMGLDVIEDLFEERETGKEHVYRLRYGDVRKAWNFAEVHFEQAIQNYRRTIDHLGQLLDDA